MAVNTGAEGIMNLASEAGERLTILPPETIRELLSCVPDVIRQIVGDIQEQHVLGSIREAHDELAIFSPVAIREILANIQEAVAVPMPRQILWPRWLMIIGVTAIVLILLVVGLLAGPIGRSMFGDIAWLDWLKTARPELHLPAEEAFSIFGFPITNTVVTAWITTIFLVTFSFAATRRLKLIPGRLQAAFEALLGWIYNLCCDVAGEENGRRFFPVVCTIFLFVGFNAWLALLPGYGSIIIHTAEGEVNLIRPANTDINMPLAIAVMSILSVQFFGLRTLGIRYAGKFINVSGFVHSLGKVLKGKVSEGFIGLITGIIEIGIGFIEFFSEFSRILSFTFRLFGNMTAGELLILVALFLVPTLFVLPFYGLELLIGFIQAMIFSGLTLIFLTLAVYKHEEAG